MEKVNPIDPITAESVVTAELQRELECLPYVYAFWLEGSFAAGTTDAYSDADYWIDVEDDKVEDALRHVEQALQRVGTIDQRSESGNNHPKLGQIVYHLAEHDRFFVLDFNWQLHSRDRNEYAYICGDTVEAAKVIFDKDDVVHFRDVSESELAAKREKWLGRCDYLFGERARVEKYILRGEFPEACAHYYEYVIEPLVILLRLRYTPLYPDYGLCHISRHLPKQDAERLSALMRVSSLEEIAAHMQEALGWAAELRK